MEDSQPPPPPSPEDTRNKQRIKRNYNCSEIIKKKMDVTNCKKKKKKMAVCNDLTDDLGYFIIFLKTRFL